MISAGEASGEKHGAALARALTTRYPNTDFSFFGSGGAEMRAANVELLVDVRELATIGLPEILKTLPGFYRAYRKLVGAALKRRPSVIILIDWPDFNMRLARRLRREGLKVVYYISPQIWAWRRHRIKALKRDVDRMLVILPFEEELYRQNGVPVEYVGHPLANAVFATSSADDFCAAHKLDRSRPIISLLPGSRHSEVRHHLPVMLDAAARLSQTGLEIAEGNRPSRAATPQFVIPLASTIERGDVELAVEEARIRHDLQLTIVERETYNALFSSTLAVIASGTATVEAALAGTPMVIIYRGSELNWRLIRPLITLDTFGMVNLIAGRKFCPELIQHDATGEKIAREVQAILSDAGRMKRIREGLDEVRNRLLTGAGDSDAGNCGANRAAAAVMRLIDAR